MKKLVIILLFSLSYQITNAQLTIKSVEGYTPQIGVLVSMLEDMKGRLESTVKELNIKDVDYLIDEDANSIGALVMHLAATEVFYQAFTFEGRDQLNAQEQDKWAAAQNLGDAARKKYTGKEIGEYLKEFDKVRAKTLELLKTKDDAWLAEMTQNMNNHWAWYHVMEHQSSHLGQILLMKKRILNN